MNGIVLVTGSSGFIGRHVVRKFLSEGFKVIGVDIVDLCGDFINENYQHIICDINSLDFEKVFELNQIDYVVHLAANSSVPYSVQYPIIDAETNYVGSIRLCELCKKYQIKRILAASSAALYAHPRYLPVKETHPVNCFSPYAITKQAMEYYISLSGLDYTILRFSNVYGPGQNKKGEAGVVSIFIDAMQKSEDVKIFGDGEQVRDFIYVKEISKAVFEAIISEKCSKKIMNISSNTAITVNELFNTIKEILGYSKDPIYLPSRRGDIKKSILDNTLAKTTFGFNPTTTLKDGLIETIASMN